MDDQKKEKEETCWPDFARWILTATPEEMKQHLSEMLGIQADPKEVDS